MIWCIFERRLTKVYFSHMKRILNIFEILICIVLASLDVWNWKMFYRDAFAVSAAFVHIPALIAYGVLVIILAKKLFTTQKLP